MVLFTRLGVSRMNLIKSKRKMLLRTRLKQIQQPSDKSGQPQEDRKLSTNVEEAEAVKLALIKAAKKCWEDTQIELSRQQLVDKIIKRKIGLSTMAGILEDIDI
ncbi:hypothetical protein ACH5RR_001190 [Cinchona calisaya]|uniref:Uncharacterized protein n=1 Tax=Cinchona calisaya TaxID=153742 RepID=A0ABD3B2U0_9GENT